jgi:hypothetical protein
VNPAEESKVTPSRLPIPLPELSAEAQVLTTTFASGGGHGNQFSLGGAFQAQVRVLLTDALKHLIGKLERGA